VLSSVDTRFLGFCIFPETCGEHCVFSFRLRVGFGFALACERLALSVGFAFRFCVFSRVLMTSRGVAWDTPRAACANRALRRRGFALAGVLAPFLLATTRLLQFFAPCDAKIFVLIVFLFCTDAFAGEHCLSGVWTGVDSGDVTEDSWLNGWMFLVRIQFGELEGEVRNDALKLITRLDIPRPAKPNWY
jgi:hypothetical protein